MHKLLDYPFDSKEILLKRKRIRRELMENSLPRIKKRIAVLGGSTTHDIKDILDLFLLNQGIEAEFYESEYAQYWQDAMFPNTELEAFCPDIIYVHTSLRNFAEFSHFSQMWQRLFEVYQCPIIQNNFEYPFYRLRGNREVSHGQIYEIMQMNLRFADYAREHEYFFINDINWISADYGLREWADPFYWHMYKYSLAMPAIPYLCHNVANIIKSIFGKNKKAFALDLDNTLWGGVIGDDGVENIDVGQETSLGQVYSEFQGYLKAHEELGVILNIVSKNEKENALSGLNRSDSILKPEDFIEIRANWDPKSQNLASIANDLSLLQESFVFVDDNPAEREIVRQQLPDVAVPEMSVPEHYIFDIDRAGYFEVTSLTEDDRKRGEQYRENAKRAMVQATFSDYSEYLQSLDMHAEIQAFEPLYIPRIAQLTNKSNQFNLTTKRYTQAEVEAAAADPNRITLYGKLTDRFGDNGVVTVTIGTRRGDTLDIDLWLMSCRVLKRDMEDALMDELVKTAAAMGVKRLIGHYYPTAKNKMVRDFYGRMGFVRLSEDTYGNSDWELNVAQYEKRCKTIKVNGCEL